jgi:hypothetical protein
MKRLIAVGLTLAIALATAAPTQAAIRVVDRAVDRGAVAVVSAAGEVAQPDRLWVKVKAHRNKGVHVDWAVKCSSGTDEGSKDGKFNALAPVRRRVSVPLRHPDSCTFVATAKLLGSGKLVLILLARVPG